MTESNSVQQAKQEIAEGMYRYCRALDRMDRTLMSTVFSSMAMVDYPTLQGKWSEFVEYIWTRHLDFDRHSHQVSNVLVWIDSGLQTAVSESYVTATLWRRSATPRTMDHIDIAIENEEQDPSYAEGIETTTTARYLDRWSRAESVWRIDRRQCVVDLSVGEDTKGARGAGERNEHDPSYLALGTSVGTCVA